MGASKHGLLTPEELTGLVEEHETRLNTHDAKIHATARDLRRYEDVLRDWVARVDKLERGARESDAYSATMRGSADATHARVGDLKMDDRVLVPVATLPSGAVVKADPTSEADPTSASYGDIAARMQLLERTLKERDGLKAQLHSFAAVAAPLRDACAEPFKHEPLYTAALQTIQMLETQLLGVRVERDKLLVQQGVTQTQLDRFMGVCSDQAVQIMELRGEVMREREARSRDLAELKPSSEMPATAWGAWQVLANQPWRNVKYWSEPGDDLPAAMREREDSWIAVLQERDRTISAKSDEIATLAAERDSLRALNAIQATHRQYIEAAHQKGVDAWRTMHPGSNGDLPPDRATVVAWLFAQLESQRALANELTRQNNELRDSANEETKRVIEMAGKARNLWIVQPSVSASPSSPLIAAMAHLGEALEEYERAESQAANADQDEADRDEYEGSFRAAADNEGARICAESRAEAEAADPGDPSQLF